MPTETKFWFEVYDSIEDPEAFYIYGTKEERTAYLRLLNELAGYPINVGGNIVYRYLCRQLYASDMGFERPRANGGVNIRDILSDLEQRVRDMRVERLDAELEDWDIDSADA